MGLLLVPLSLGLGFSLSACSGDDNDGDDGASALTCFEVLGCRTSCSAESCDNCEVGASAAVNGAARRIAACARDDLSLVPHCDDFAYCASETTASLGLPPFVGTWETPCIIPLPYYGIQITEQATWTFGADGTLTIHDSVYEASGFYEVRGSELVYFQTAEQNTFHLEGEHLPPEGSLRTSTKQNYAWAIVDGGALTLDPSSPTPTFLPPGVTPTCPLVDVFDAAAAQDASDAAAD